LCSKNIYRVDFNKWGELKIETIMSLSTSKNDSSGITLLILDKCMKLELWSVTKALTLILKSLSLRIIETIILFRLLPVQLFEIK